METLLWQQCILFAADHFSEDTVEFLTKRVIEMGGTTTTQREGSTILLVNPSHQNYKKELEHTAKLVEDYPKIEQPKIIPYHWISNIYHHQRKIPVEELGIISPIFTYPSQYENFRPIRAWVSVNVSREQEESPEQARDNLLRKLECSGAIRVNKRSHADLLVVDESSQFAKKVYEEKKKYNRDWQKIVERDWIDNCLKSKSLNWKLNTNQNDDQDQDDNESFLGDDDFTGTGNGKEGGKGSGRPTGQPRVDYTPQDDDFLCRYLAAHHPGGSWSSRKTYQTLVDLATQYPIAQRHTAQSWHERFKKNSIHFDKRIRVFVRDGVNGTLKTRTERDKARKAKLASQEQATSETGTNPTPQESEAGPSRSTATQSTAQASAADGRAGKRKLVDLEEEDSLPPASTPNAEREKRARQDEQEIEAEALQAQARTIHPPDQSVPEQQPPQPNQQPEPSQDPHSNQPIQAIVPIVAAGPEQHPQTTSDVVSKVQLALGTSEIAAPQDDIATSPVVTTEVQAEQSSEPTTTQKRKENASEAVIEESLSDLLPTASQLPAAASLDSIGNRTVDTDLVDRDLMDLEMEDSVVDPSSQIETDVNEDDDEESQRGQATQAILDDFAQAQASARQIAQQTEPRETPVKAGKSVRVDDDVDVRIIPPEPSTENTAPAQSEVPASQQQQSAQPAIHVPSSPIPKSPKRPAPAISQTMQEQNFAPAANNDQSTPSDGRAARVSVPPQQDVDTRIELIAEEIQRHNKHSQRPTEARPPVETPRRDAQNGRSPLSDIPNRTPRNSLLYEHLSASASKRRKTLDRMSGGGGSENRRGGPDMVFRETSIPPRPIRRDTSSSPAIAVARASSSTREPSPPLSAQERNERALKGKNLIQKSIQDYKNRISNLSQKYGMTPSQIISFINNDNSKQQGNEIGAGKGKNKNSGEKYWEEIERGLDELQRRR